MKIYGKNLNKHRLKWWAIIILTCVFGRYVEVEGSRKRKKILPWIWRNKLYLFGMQHHGARIVFDGKYSLRMIEAQHVKPSLGKREQTPDLNNPPKFLHAVLIHYRPEETNPLVAKWAELAGSDDNLFVGYGGPEKHYESIAHRHKAFIPQKQIWVNQPGGTHSYTHFILKAADYCIESGREGMLVTDGDAWPCALGYLNQLCLPPWRVGCDFSATRLRDVTGTSFLFPECPTHTIPHLEEWVRKHNLIGPNSSARIMHHFAPLMYFSREILIKMREYCSNEPPSHVEKTLGSYALHLGATYCSYEEFNVYDTPEWLRYRPNLQVDQLRNAIAESIPLIHPVKNNNWVSEYSCPPHA